MHRHLFTICTLLLTVKLQKICVLVLVTDHKIVCYLTRGNVDGELDSIPALMMFGSHLILFQQWGTQC